MSDSDIEEAAAGTERVTATEEFHVHRKRFRDFLLHRSRYSSHTERHKLARNGHAEVSWRCPLLGEQRKHLLLLSFSGFDPTRTSSAAFQGSPLSRPKNTIAFAADFGVRGGRDDPKKSHTRRALCDLRKALEYPNRGKKGI